MGEGGTSHVYKAAAKDGSGTFAIKKIVKTGCTAEMFNNEATMVWYMLLRAKLYIF